VVSTIGRTPIGAKSGGVLTPPSRYNLTPMLTSVKIGNCIHLLELTICHETNFESAKIRKTEKYRNIRANLNAEFSQNSVKIFTIEVSVFGFVSDSTLLRSQQS